MSWFQKLFSKPRLREGQIISGSLCQTRGEHFDRQITQIGSEGIVVKHVCGTKQDLVNQKDYNKIKQKLYSDAYVFIPRNKTWLPEPVSNKFKKYSLNDYFLLILEYFGF